MVSGLSNTEPTFVKDIMQDEAPSATCGSA
jgi:hypothetical protein